MAAAEFGGLKEEATCSICLDYLEDPVSIPCGHNFCCSCITDCLEGPDELSCPQCRRVIRKGRLRPKWQLRNIVGKLKEQEALLCEEHKQALVLFCEEDHTPVCVVCERSAQHRAHTVDLIEDAANAYKVCE
ncbi:hypothetical protein NDU88_000769 [Pleurodeles waltl]|uniref:Uncharacterized protein n=1 Tax=Pleurodeles waltl TaxID=8319 RepID=A0AAV7Q435_PLEWA|nr:hypothetical protein NDU88_000769 [Pleurodeles waltl]